MRWGSLFSLDSVVKARPHEFAMLFCSMWRPGRAVEGGKGTRWPHIPQCGEGRARLTFPGPGAQRPPQKSSPGSCTTAFSVVDHSPNTSSAFRSAPFIDDRLPQNQPRSAQEALELAPTASAGPPGAAGRCAEPIQSPVHISHTSAQTNQLLPQIGGK